MNQDIDLAPESGVISTLFLPSAREVTDAHNIKIFDENDYFTMYKRTFRRDIGAIIGEIYREPVQSLEDCPESHVRLVIRTDHSD